MRRSREQVLNELAEFIAERKLDRLPTTAELCDAGRSGLVYAIYTYTEGLADCAQSLGRPTSIRPRGPRRVADPVTEARALIEQLGYLPGQNKLRNYFGHYQLAREVKQAGGPAAFCALHGLAERHVPAQVQALRRNATAT